MVREVLKFSKYKHFTTGDFFAHNSLLLKHFLQANIFMA